MYFVFSLLRKESKVIGVKWPILKSSCSGGSVDHFHENHKLLADEEIIINKLRSHPQKEIWHSFSSVSIALKPKMYEKNIQNIENYFIKWDFYAKALVWFCFQTPLFEKFEIKKKNITQKERLFPRYIPIWKTFLPKTLCIIK